jgi:type I restriction enzyme S subunit
MPDANVRLADLCDFIAVQVDPAMRVRGAYVGLEHLVPGRFVRAGQGDASDVTSSKYEFLPGDVLYGKLRPYLDKAVLVHDTGICTTELLVLRAKPGVDPRFLVAVLHAPTLIDHAVAGTTGAQHPRTSWNHIRDFALPSFDRDEQGKIADLLWSVQGAVVANEAASNASLNLKRTAMRTLFTKGLLSDGQRESEFGLVPEAWHEMPLDSCSTVQTGVTKGRAIPDGEAVDVPYLRVANVQDGRLDLSEIKRIRIRKSEVERYRLRPGDVVLTEGGDFDKLGRGFIWRGEVELCVHQNHVFAVRPNPDQLNPEFFAYLAQSPYGKSYFLRVAHKTTNLACINSTKLKAFPVLVPPNLDEQREIVSILAAIDRKSDLLERKRNVLEKLFKILLHKLVTGQIRAANLDLSTLVSDAAAA